jgi:transmembrane sensor
MNEDEVLEAAAWWHAMQQGDDMEWLAFETWLAADARHRDAFDRIALLDSEVDLHRERLLQMVGRGGAPAVPASPSPSWDGSMRRSGRARLITFGSVVAGALACLLIVVDRAPRQQSAPADPKVVRSGGGTRNVAVGGAAIALAPRSRIRWAAADGASVELAGRARFDVEHDPAREFLVVAAGYEIRDVGTRFEVVSGGDAMQVSVAAGEVSVRRVGSGTTPIRITAGHSATGLPDGRITTGRAAPDRAVGQGQAPLVYDGAPLGLVVADVARATGTSVTIDRSLEGRSFSGVLAAGDADARVATLAALAGLNARRQGDAVHLVARGGR